MTAKSLRKIYQLKVTLKGVRPPVWRRLQIAGSDTLEDLHIVLQIVMGWTNSHLHEFVKGDLRYGVPDDDFPSDICEEVDYRLDQVLQREKERLRYIYDFGDNWDHDVVLEKILPFSVDAVLPACSKGVRACPPEDIGGFPGYAMFLEAISDPAHPDHEDMLDWYGDDFDPEHFDLEGVNNLLREYCD